MSYSPRVVVLEGKHPSEVLDYSLDFDAWLVGAEALSAITSVTVGSGLTLGTGGQAPAISGTTVVWWLSGGTTGTTYAIEVIVTTSGGRTLVADCTVTVTDPSP